MTRWMKYRYHLTFPTDSFTTVQIYDCTLSRTCTDLRLYTFSTVQISDPVHIYTCTDFRLRDFSSQILHIFLYRFPNIMTLFRMYESPKRTIRRFVHIRFGDSYSRRTVREKVIYFSLTPNRLKQLYESPK